MVLMHKKQLLQLVVRIDDKGDDLSKSERDLDRGDDGMNATTVTSSTI